MVSNHGYERAKERMHLKTMADAERYFRNASERGKSYSEFTGIEKEYLRSKESSGISARVYNSNVYIFDDEWRGITVYPVPEWFGKKVIHQGKQIFRNLSCYKNWCYSGIDAASTF